MNVTREIGNSSKTGTRVLLVEDHSDSAKAMARLLRTFGFQVEITYRLAEARAAARAGKFDLIICDIALPDGSGLDLMRELRPAHPGLKAIALSGYGAPADVQSSKEAGFNAHVVKPIDFTRLREVIEQVASN